MPRQVTSFSNETVKRIRALRDKKARKAEGDVRPHDDGHPDAPSVPQGV